MGALLQLEELTGQRRLRRGGGLQEALPELLMARAQGEEVVLNESFSNGSKGHRRPHGENLCHHPLSRKVYPKMCTKLGNFIWCQTPSPSLTALSFGFT